jgi:hypothetical protein
MLGVNRHEEFNDFTMTQARGIRTHGLGLPSSPWRLPGAMLCTLVELARNAAAYLRMRVSRLIRECHTKTAPDALPADANGASIEETTPAAARGETVSPLRQPAAQSVFPSRSRVEANCRARRKEGACVPTSQMGEVDHAPQDRETKARAAARTLTPYSLFPSSSDSE